MTSKNDRVSPPSTDDEESSGDGRDHNGRRRRFCIERRQDLEPTSGSSGTKRCRIDTIVRNRIGSYHKNTGKRRTRPYFDYQAHQQTHRPAAYPKPRPKLDPPKGPVIFISPNFIRRFVEKSFELSMQKRFQTSDQSTATASTMANQKSSATFANDKVECVDFRTCHNDVLQQAATMTVIRLVTECIEDARKRDERLNKTLVSRLIDALRKHGQQDKHQSTHQPDRYNDPQLAGSSRCSDHQEFSEDISAESSSGQPIPVIGGKVNHHFDKSRV